MHGMTGKGARRNHILMANFGRHSHCVAFQELGTVAGREDSHVILASSRMVRVDSSCSVALLRKQTLPPNAHSPLYEAIWQLYNSSLTQTDRWQTPTPPHGVG